VKTVSELKKEQQDKRSAILNRYGIFFAFSTKQFDEQKQEDVTYVSGGSGMFIPKNNVEDVKSAFAQCLKECTKEFQEQIQLDDYITYELANHEAWYTGDIYTALEVVQTLYPECTIEDVRRVYKDKREEMTA